MEQPCEVHIRSSFQNGHGLLRFIYTGRSESDPLRDKYLVVAEERGAQQLFELWRNRIVDVLDGPHAAKVGLVQRGGWLRSLDVACMDSRTAQ